MKMTFPARINLHPGYFPGKGQLPRVLNRDAVREIIAFLIPAHKDVAAVINSCIHQLMAACVQHPGSVYHLVPFSLEFRSLRLRHRIQLQPSISMSCSLSNTTSGSLIFLNLFIVHFLTFLKKISSPSSILISSL